MAHALDLKLIAEGVDRLQGYPTCSSHARGTLLAWLQGDHIRAG
ncbi:MAG: hypothetical protein P8Z69_00025 [Acidihalobacter sp.]